MSLLEVRKKIEATRNTQKITKAMQLVAANKMKHFQRAAVATRAYAQTIRAACARVESPARLQPPEGVQPTDVLFVLLTSDKGLCGAMNAQVIRGLQSYEAWKNTPPEHRKVITIGRKAAEAARRLKLPLVRSFQNVPERLDSVQAWELIGAILESWDAGTCAQVHMVSPEHISAFVFNIRSRQYLPFTVEAEAAEPADFIEPSAEEASARLARMYLEAEFMEAFAHLKATEYSSRMVAMKKAMDAAGELVRSLTAAYNKVRQATITQELAELATAGAAMEDESIV